MTELWKKIIYLSLTIPTVMPLIRGQSFEGEIPKKISSSQNPVEMVISTSADPGVLEYYLSHWNGSAAGSRHPEDDIDYYGEGLPDVFFQSQNDSLILEGLSRCLYDFNFVTCLKFLLVNRLDNVLDYMRENNLTRTDFSFMMGLVKFKVVPGANHFQKRKGALGLDQDISYKFMELFEDRSFQLNLLPGFGMDLAPVPNDGDFLGFRARPYLTFWKNEIEGDEKQNEVRGRKKRKKGGFQMPSMMILPQLVMLGFMPFALANLQAMVMNAFMLNMMALNSAIFMTIRNLVFGPKGGPKIKYVNYGYRKKKKSSVPTIIVHSPAAFVKQPFRRRKRPPPGDGPNFYHRDIPGSFPHFHQSEESNFHPENVIAPENYGKENFFEDVEHGKGAFLEEGGKNKVRIRITSKAPTSMRELLHRIKYIENDVKGGFIPHSENEFHSLDEPQTVRVIPLRNSDDITSHGFNDPQHLHPSAIELEEEGYDRNQFMPIINHPQREKH